MFASGFSMNTDRVAEAYGGPTEQFLAATAKQHRIHLLGGVAMRGKDGQARNKALLFDPEGNLTGYYAKRRPFRPGGEHEHYTAGTKAAVLNCGPCRVSPFVCYDLRFPELFREAAKSARPELYVVIANFPSKRVLHWVRLLQARAIENQAYVVGVNRVGRDPFYEYSGRSLIIDPQGEIIADAGDHEGAIQAELDLECLAQYRSGLPFLDDLG
jgi:predicted amidohydrolase